MRFDPYADAAIKRDRTDAAALTIEEARALTNWCDWHPASWTDGLSLAEVLALYHAAIEWDSLNGWLEERPAEAVAAYNAAVKDAARHWALPS